MADKPEDVKDKKSETSDSRDLFNSAFNREVPDTGSQNQGTQIPSG